MKKIISLLTLVAASTSVYANDLSSQNLVKRSLTLVDGELQIAGSLGYGEQEDNDKSWALGLHAAYGLTDDLTIEGLGLRYRLMERPNDGAGLELTTAIGAVGHYDAQQGDDSVGWGFDITGKYVFDRDTAVLFGTEYVYWDEDLVDNRSEYRYSLGLQQNIYRDVTLTANYTYRDLNDFVQNNAYNANIGINYAIDKQWDAGMFVGISDFNPLENGYKAEDIFDKQTGVYLSYRF